MPGSLRRIGQAPVSICVSQLSANGCRLTGPDLSLDIGEKVELTISSVGPLQAEVRWVGPDMAGVQLAASLDPAILQYFASFIHLAG